MSIFDVLARYGKVRNVKTDEVKELKQFPLKYLGLYFTATWCSYCWNIVDKLPALVAKVNAKGQFLRLLTIRLDDDNTNFGYSFLRFNFINNDLASEIAGKLGVRHIPNIVIFDYLGRLVTTDGLKDIMKHKEGTIEYWDGRIGLK